MNLSLRWRTALVVALVTTLALGVLLAFDRLVLVSGFQQFEDEEVRRDVSRVAQVIDSECDRLAVLISDWAQWDDTYDFMETRSPAFVASNLSPNILDDLGLAAMIFLDTTGTVVEARMAKPGGRSGSVDELMPDAGLSRIPDILRIAAEPGHPGGIIRTEAGPPAAAGRAADRAE